MQVWSAMPSETEIRAAVLATTIRPMDRMPVVVGRCRVIANVVDVLPRVSAAAVYWEPPVERPHRTYRPGRLLVVVGERTAEPHVTRWYQGVLGEVGEAPRDPLDLSGYRDPGGHDGRE